MVKSHPHTFLLKATPVRNKQNRDHSRAATSQSLDSGQRSLLRKKRKKKTPCGMSDVHPSPQIINSFNQPKWQKKRREIKFIWNIIIDFVFVFVVSFGWWLAVVFLFVHSSGRSKKLCRASIASHPTRETLWPHTLLRHCYFISYLFVYLYFVTGYKWWSAREMVGAPSQTHSTLNTSQVIQLKLNLL